MGMKIHDIQVNVLGCIIISDCPLKDKCKIMMRFFCNDPDVDNVHKKLIRDKNHPNFDHSRNIITPIIRTMITNEHPNCDHPLNILTIISCETS